MGSPHHTIVLLNKVNLMLETLQLLQVEKYGTIEVKTRLVLTYFTYGLKRRNYHPKFFVIINQLLYYSRHRCKTDPTPTKRLPSYAAAIIEHTRAEMA